MTYRICGKAYVLDRLLSEGGFAFVWLAKEVASGQTVVLKRILCQDADRYRMAQREIEVMIRVSPHPNIIGYQGHVTTQNGPHKEVIIVLDFCQGGSLIDLMGKFGNQIPATLALQAIKDITSALCHLHSLNPPIQHRDLKLENVLFSKNRFVLIDFGSCSDAASDPSNLPREELLRLENDIERYTTLMYRPPEMVDLYRGFPITTKVDMWMLGCIVFSLIVGKHPFQDESSLAISNARYRLDEDLLKYPKGLYCLCKWLLSSNPVNRPSSADLLSIFQKGSSPEEVFELIEEKVMHAQHHVPKPRQNKFPGFIKKKKSMVDQFEFGEFKKPEVSGSTDLLEIESNSLATHTTGWVAEFDNSQPQQEPQEATITETSSQVLDLLS